jgi:hypothetical protein
MAATEKPPIISSQHRRTGRRLLITVLVVLLTGFGILVLLGYLAMPKPPKENELIQNFYMNRPAFEQLRNMLQADPHLRRVADWGVETRGPFYLGYPSASNFPTDRYRRYLALLKQAGGQLASRSEGEHSDPSILVWGSGWAGDTKHIGICWMDEPPTNQVPTLDGYHDRSRYPEHQVAFRHIDEKWYLWTDL